ncbi:hypothetical protein Poli38472_002766 [Pythium oligandrum]|uniref:RRM domain-containing protein n=1 Tax=Pythium oligandrum TaxID=41045 RepID=A0A8K1FHE7_PYTOL|nr:hypothetical protein Poli38472_002766 [Pythium oligandrum]|eukprot:TMW63825.1 hypothetical protein Poli38472_002766 [Pythium oligandrum]
MWRILTIERSMKRRQAETTDGHRVWVGRVPSHLCVDKSEAESYFGEHGEILHVETQHQLIDMSADGFIFLTYATKEAAMAAVDAVESGRRAGDHEMQAALALSRGPVVATVDRDVADLLLGRRQASQANRFSQHSMMDDTEADEEELMLQSLSQRSFTSSKKHKKHKKRKMKMELSFSED